jgi:hypothetical protein
LIEHSSACVTAVAVPSVLHAAAAMQALVEVSVSPKASNNIKVNPSRSSISHAASLIVSSASLNTMTYRNSVKYMHEEHTVKVSVKLDKETFYSCTRRTPNVTS